MKIRPYYLHFYSEEIKETRVVRSDAFIKSATTKIGFKIVFNTVIDLFDLNVYVFTDDSLAEGEVVDLMDDLVLEYY